MTTMKEHANEGSRTHYIRALAWGDTNDIASTFNVDKEGEKKTHGNKNRRHAFAMVRCVIFEKMQCDA